MGDSSTTLPPDFVANYNEAMKRDSNPLELGLALQEERMLIKEIFADKDTSLSRKIYVKASASIIESELFALKRMILDAHKMNAIELSHEELAILLEESYTLSDKGKINVKPYFSSLTSNIKFIFCLGERLSRLLGYKSTIRFSISNSSNQNRSNATGNSFDDPRWSSLQKSVKVRNRVTHPKKLADLQVTDKELVCLEEGENWFFESIYTLKIALFVIHRYQRTEVTREEFYKVHDEIWEGLSSIFEEFKR